MTLLRESFLYHIWMTLLSVYDDSMLRRVLAAVGGWCNRQIDESRVLRVLCREGIVARSWPESLVCRSLTWVVNLPGALLHKLYRSFRTVFEDSFFARLAFEMGEGTAIAQSWLIMLLWVIPFSHWNNAYSMIETSMDYLQKAIDKFRADKIEAKNLPFCEIIKPMDVDWRKANSRLYNKVYEIINKIKTMRESIQSVYIGYSDKTKDEKKLITKEVAEIRSRCVDYIANIHFNDVEMYLLLREIDKDKNAGFARTIFDTLFATGNADLYEMIRSSSDEQYKLSKKSSENCVRLFNYDYFKQKIG